MITPKVWFKLVNPTDNWTKVSLEEVDDVDDLKKKIKIEMAPKLDIFTSSSLTLKATYNNDNPNEAVELHEKEELVSVLRRFNIEETNVKDSFAKNIRLFVIASSDEHPGKRKLPTIEYSTKKRKSTDSLFDNVLVVIRQLINKTTVSGLAPNDIIKLPSDLDFPVIERSSLYVRKAYADIYELLVKLGSVKAPNLKHKFILTGTSGVGKSCFMVYFLIRMLCEQKGTVIFEHPTSSVFYCFENTSLRTGNFENFSNLFESSETWYLADGITSPQYVNAKTIVALSPKGINNKEFQDFEKKAVWTFYMPPWLLEELKICREHIFSNVPEDLMLDIFYKSGGIPRYVLERAETALLYNSKREVVLEQALKRIDIALKSVKNFDDLVRCFAEDVQFVKFSNRLVHRWPSSGYDKYYLKWASVYVFNKVQEKLEDQSWSNLLERIPKMMRYYPSASGIMFEAYVIHLFRIGNHKFKTRSLLYDKTSTLSLRGKLEVELIRNPEDLSNYTTGQKNVLFIPNKDNFGAADFIISPNRIFQVTVSKEHPIKQVELTRIVENMPDSKEIRFYFVVPDEVYDEYELQKITTYDINAKNQREVQRKDSRLKNVHQWALRIEINPKAPEQSKNLVSDTD